MKKISSRIAQYIAISIVFTAFIFPKICLCQDLENPVRPRNSAAQYYLGSEDELLKKVNVWGFVHKPGQYLVPSDTDLISLLSFVGGPLENANLKNIKLIRNNKNPGEVLKINVKKFIKNGNAQLIPALLPGDTIIVSASKFHYVNKALEFTTRIGMIVQIIWYYTLIKD